jgi:hypothetical protein
MVAQVAQIRITCRKSSKIKTCDFLKNKFVQGCTGRTFSIRNSYLKKSIDKKYDNKSHG